MAITKDAIKVVQSELNKRHNLNLTVDGIDGKNTQDALSYVGMDPGWPAERRLVGCIQYFAQKEGIEVGTIDGRWGPQTENAFDELEHFIAHGKLPDPWRAEEADEGGDHTWPHQSEATMTAFYGDVGENQGKCNSPYPLKLAWDLDKVVNRFTCHEKVAPVIERILKKVLDHYGLEEIQRLRLDLWGGALNVRKMRGGTKWSTHSWGTSVDWDPSNNRLKWGKDKATLSGPEYDFWWKCWEEEGAVSLGREQNRDWMHVQFARIK